MLGVAVYFLNAEINIKENLNKLEQFDSVAEGQLKATVANKVSVNVHRWVSTHDERKLQIIKSQKVSQVQDKKVLVNNFRSPSSSLVDRQVEKPLPAFYVFNTFSLPKERFGKKMSWTIAPVSISEITGKRKKIAKGENLYARVIKKREVPPYWIK